MLLAKVKYVTKQSRFSASQEKLDNPAKLGQHLCTHQLAATE